MKIRTVRRGTSEAGVAHIAGYRAGDNIVDERTGNRSLAQTLADRHRIAGEFATHEPRLTENLRKYAYLHKYDWRKKDVRHAEIVLPTQFSNDAQLDWARDRSTLWNMIGHSEPRKNSRVAYDYMVILPSELTHAQRLDLTRSFAQTLADRHRNAVDFAIHEPRLGHSENHHAHLLATTREVTRTRLGRPIRIERREVREIWKDSLEKALHAAGKAGVRADKAELAQRNEGQRSKYLKNMQEHSVKNWLQLRRNQKVLEQAPVTAREKERTRKRDDGLER